MPQETRVETQYTNGRIEHETIPSPTPASKPPSASDAFKKEKTPAAPSPPFPHAPPETAIHVGPFIYNKETDEIFFENHRLNFTGHAKKKALIAKLIKSYPKPVNSEDMQIHLYGEAGRSQGKLLNALYIKTLEFLDLCYDGSANFITYRDERGLRILPISGKPDLQQLPQDRVIVAGPWAFDENSEIIFFRNKPITCGPFLYKACTAAIKNFPRGIDINSLAIEAFGLENASLEEIHTARERLMRDLPHIQKKATEKHTHVDSLPLWTSLPNDEIVINVPPKDWTEKIKAQMGIISHGDFHLVTTQGRIFIESTPVKRLGPQTWKAISALEHNKGQFIPGIELARDAYDLTDIPNGTAFTKHQDAIGTLLRKAKNTLNRFSNGVGDHYIRSHLTYGFIFCRSDEEYNAALAKAQQDRPYAIPRTPASGPEPT